MNAVVKSFLKTAFWDLTAHKADVARFCLVWRPDPQDVQGHEVSLSSRRGPEFDLFIRDLVKRVIANEDVSSDL